jgi:isocitrate/isopropylmalate dehydrogenase
MIKGQGIGPECIKAARTVLDATGLKLEYVDGHLGYPDAKDLIPMVQAHCPSLYAGQFGDQDPLTVANKLELEAKAEARAGGNINDFYKKLLAKLSLPIRREIKTLITDLEKKTLREAASCSAVLKGALRTLDEGEEPSRNVTIRKAFEQYANIRRCVTLQPITSELKTADILFVRENVEDLYASIEHRLSRNYPQALRHLTPEGCELIIRAAFEAALRDGRKRVTALEKPNILKITGGLFKEVFLRVAKDYNQASLGENALEAQFMIIDDGLAAIAANPEKFDVVVTTNMFGDIGSDVAAKVTGGVGFVSSNNTNPSNPHAVSMFETMGGTADDIAGEDKANPVALIDAAAEMLIHIGGQENIMAGEFIKTAILEVLADGYYIGDIKKGPYQVRKAVEPVGTQAFARKIAEKVSELRAAKAANPEKSIKEIALDRAEDEIKPLFARVLRSYEKFAERMRPGSREWVEFARRNIPPNPVRARSRIVGFDMFIDHSGAQPAFLPDGRVDSSNSMLDVRTVTRFQEMTGLEVSSLFNQGQFSSLQSLRSFAQFSSRFLREYLAHEPAVSGHTLGQVLETLHLAESFSPRFASSLLQTPFAKAVEQIETFTRHSIQLIQAFYLTRVAAADPILREHGFKIVRVTSRGTEIYPTMCDFEKRDVDRFRVELDPDGKLANEGFSHAQVQSHIMQAQEKLTRMGWVIAETMLNRSFTDGEGSLQGQEISGVSVPYAKALGTDYSQL